MKIKQDIDNFQVDTFRVSTAEQLLSQKDIKHPVEAIDTSLPQQSQTKTALVKVLPAKGSLLKDWERDLDVCNELLWSYY